MEIGARMMKDKNYNPLVKEDFVRMSNFNFDKQIMIGRVKGPGERLNTVLIQWGNLFYTISENFLEKLTDGEATLYILEHVNNQ